MKRAILRAIGRLISPIAVLMLAVDGAIASYCAWKCLWNDCYDHEKDNLWRKLNDMINKCF